MSPRVYPFRGIGYDRAGTGQNPDNAAGGERQEHAPVTDAELLRLRQTDRELELELVRHDGRLKDQARGLGELRDVVRQLRADHDDLEERIDGMTTAEKIAAGVATGIARERRARWTTFRKIGAGAGATILLVPALHDAALWLF